MKMVIIPGQCPFKEDILKEVAAFKKQKEDEKQKRREEALAKKKAAKEGKSESPKTAPGSLPLALESTDSRGLIELPVKGGPRDYEKVLETADVILEVVDARDPLGTRCKEVIVTIFREQSFSIFEYFILLFFQVEEAVFSDNGKKKMILILNKADLVPKENLKQWLEYFREHLPTVAFKSAIYAEAQKSAHKKHRRQTVNRSELSPCLGAELVLSLLQNYSTENSKNLQVGVIGLPNVGKSSVINSLKGFKACNPGSNPGNWTFGI